MLRIRDNRRMRVAFLSLFLIGVFCRLPVLGQELTFDGRHRVNAHGSEFNGLVMSADRQRLFVASENGHAIVWNIAAGQIDQRFDHSAPVHLIAALAGPQEFVTAGSYHFQPRNAVIRRWDAKAGTHVDLEGLDASSFPAALATEPNTGLIVLTTLEGVIHVWDAASNKQIAKWEIKDIPIHAVLLGRDLYVGTMDRKAFEDREETNESAIIKFNVDDPKSGPTDYLRIPERKWTSLGVTPDYRMLVATYDAPGGERIKSVLIDPASKTETARLPQGDIAWIDSLSIAVVENQIILPEGDRLRFVPPETGQITRELRFGSPILATAVSANRKWLAVVDNARKTTVFELATLKKRRIASKSEDAGPLAFTNDGRTVYRVAHGGRLLMWDMKTAKLKETVLTRVREMHSNVDFMTLANDDKWVVVAGNHGDVGVFDRLTGRLLSYTQVSAAAFYVEKVWVRGDRMIFSTDTGALFDARLK